jgi:Flp pilus assembly protein TadG
VASQTTLGSRTLSPQFFRRTELGSASIEVAVTASVLFMTLIGLMKICLAIYTFHFVSEAAREGTRYAIVRGTSCNTTYFPTACPASKTDISNYVKGLGYPGISSSAMTVTTSYATYPAGKTCTPSAACNNPTDLVTIQVQYAFPLSIPFMSAKTYTMTSTSAMIISQ